jgi:hypothetical protein
VNDFLVLGPVVANLADLAVVVGLLMTAGRLALASASRSPRGRRARPSPGG